MQSVRRICDRACCKTTLVTDTPAVWEAGRQLGIRGQKALQCIPPGRMAVEGGSSLHRVLQQGAGGFSNLWRSNDMHIFWHVFDQSSVQLWQGALSHRVRLRG